MLITESNDFSEYLLDLPELQIHSKEITEITKSLFLKTDSDVTKVKKAFTFVRDHFSHSWDIQEKQVTVTAIDVLNHGHGICYAKSNLLAAILRKEGIPTGFCYQRLLLLDDVLDKYCIHALNGIYLTSLNKWIRLDARGNKKNVQAEFCLNKEKLAFTPNINLGEKNDPTIYLKPNPLTIKCLVNSKDTLEMYLNDLPDNLF